MINRWFDCVYDIKSKICKRKLPLNWLSWCTTAKMRPRLSLYSKSHENKQALRCYNIKWMFCKHHIGWSKTGCRVFFMDLINTIEKKWSKRSNIELIMSKEEGVFGGGRYYERIRYERLAQLSRRHKTSSKLSIISTGIG